MNIDMQYILETTKALVAVPSPVGYYKKMKPVLSDFAAKLGYTITYDNRDTAYIRVRRCPR